ncbi:hypothetical protein [Staphylothermus hellenicus]|uniref:Late embryogenesis abundant protein LEA-2 subgroup domain-containing protein n=1 Tax=Staphylothermus hellenicus (strain DSM 12710 / JCM 10830 / BK20S6-10-b1 / P8) TaxID=591019 RepID=D7DC78_STAHD|nr:hypothetical protein [Staphylothermus hellenicus]ADI31775.1 hypothetical protein Shell_0652 [Staphylothermus hellenicus DSM 12710]
MVKVISRLWGILTGLIVIGIIIYIGLLWVTAQNISAQIKSIDTLTYDLAENKVLVCFRAQVNNTGYIDVSIEKLYYKVYIDKNYLGEGIKENILIKRGINNIDFCLQITPSNALRIILMRAITNNEKINVTVQGYIDVPIKSFGYIKLWTLELPYKETFYVKVTR